MRLFLKGWTRRRFMTGFSLAVLGQIWPIGRLSAKTPSRGKGSVFRIPRNVYAELGVRPIINCQGTHTSLGASVKWPEVDAPMAEAARSFVFLDELQEKVGKRLAELIGAEAAMVTTGAAGAITLGTCACLTGKDLDKVRQLPDTTGMRNEVIIQKVHRNPYDHAIRNAGARLVVVETSEQLYNAINERTAMMYYLGGTTGDWAWETDPIPLEECVAAGKKAGFPVLVDCANLLPPWENIRRVAASGAELLAISGGKHIRGPQCSGILAGRRDLIEAALLNNNPNPDSVGRPMKVGREEIIGLWVAVELYVRQDFAALDRYYHEQCEYVIRKLGKIPGLKVGYMPYERVRKVPRVYVQWDEEAFGLTTDECVRQLLEGEPRIAVLKREDQGIFLTFFSGLPGDEKIVARRLAEIFRAALEQRA